MTISRLKEFTVCDYSEYEEDKSRNGGCYSYHDHYKRFNDGWRVEHWDSSEFCQNDFGFDESEVFSDFEIAAVILEVVSAGDANYYIDHIIEREG